MEWFYIVNSTRTIVIPIMAADKSYAMALANEMFVESGGGVALDLFDIENWIPQAAFLHAKESK